MGHVEKVVPVGENRLHLDESAVRENPNLLLDNIDSVVGPLITPIAEQDDLIKRVVVATFSVLEAEGVISKDVQITTERLRAILRVANIAVGQKKEG